MLTKVTKLMTRYHADQTKHLVFIQVLLVIINSIMTILGKKPCNLDKLVCLTSPFKEKKNMLLISFFQHKFETWRKISRKITECTRWPLVREKSGNHFWKLVKKILNLLRKSGNFKILVFVFLAPFPDKSAIFSSYSLSLSL